MYCLTNQEQSAVTGAQPMSQPVRMGIVGVGKIARDQHIPCIGAHPGFKLLAVASRNNAVEGIASYPSLEGMLAGSAELDAVAICTPPQAHYEAAKTILASGRHVLMEKPPCASLGQLDGLVRLAKAAGRTLYQTWHSQHARAVEPAGRLLQERRVHRVRITWKEDVRRWHPGQDWIWDAGNFGVFDPGINALSILTKILPAPAFVKSAELLYPANRDTPIAASLVMSSLAAEDAASTMVAEFDWRQEGEQSWNIDIATSEGTALRLTHGGSKLLVDGVPTLEAPMAEYEGIYRHFAQLLDAGEGAMDAAPFQLVADAFLVGRRATTASFNW
jgi:D-galactose 1-dehydrogenase